MLLILLIVLIVVLGFGAPIGWTYYGPWAGGSIGLLLVILLIFFLLFGFR